MFKPEDRFRVVLPAELVKSNDGEWRIRGLASTENLDDQGEIVLQKGMDLTPIDQKKGIIDWEHRGQKSPEFIIGVLDGYAKTPKGVFVEGRLFKEHAMAKAVKGILDSLGEKDRGRVGLSVEGGIIRRNAKNPKIVERSIVTGVAITLNPVNSDTYADLVKSFNAGELEFASEGMETPGETKTGSFTAEQVAELVKALGVGSGYMGAPTNLSGGAALAMQSLDGKKTKVVEKLEKDGGGETDKDEEATDDKAEKTDKENPLLKKSWQTFEHRMAKSRSNTPRVSLKKSLVDLLDKLSVLYPGNSRTEIWNAIEDRLNTKFPDINSPKIAKIL